MKEITKFFMIGTLHDDLRGRERLLKFLDKLKPVAVSVESNDNQLRWAQFGMPKVIEAAGRILAKRGLTPEEVTAYKHWKNWRPPFERVAVEEFSRNSNTPFFAIDLFDDKEKMEWARGPIKVAREVELWNFMQFEGLSEESHQSITDEDYRTIRMNCLYNGTVVPYDDPDVGRRDEYMAARILDIVRQYPHGKVVHIGGTKHVFDDPWNRTLFSRLKNLSPQRHFLDEADDTDRVT